MYECVLPRFSALIVRSPLPLFFCVCQMMLPLTQILNSLHSLKNTATASVQTLHRDFIQEQSSLLKEVRRA